MTLTSSQHAELVEVYSTHIVEGLDREDLIAMCYDLLCREYDKCTEKELIKDIMDGYGEDVAIELIQSMGVDPDMILFPESLEYNSKM